MSLLTSVIELFSPSVTFVSWSSLFFDDVKCLLEAQHVDQWFAVFKKARKSENENDVMLIAGFEGVYLYIIYFK